MSLDNAIKNDEVRERATAKDALSKSNREIVELIFIESNTHRNNEVGLISRPLAYFSALLVKLSDQAEKLSKQLLYLTWAILAFTAIIVFLSFFEFPKISIQFHNKTNTHSENAQQSNQPKQPKPKVPTFNK